MLEGLENCVAFIDDILIWAKTREELSVKLKQVLQRLLDHNVKINYEKCNWFVDKVVYLGHVISRDGISVNPKKLKAIVDSPRPQNVTQLKSFLGMINFYAKFMDQLSLKTAKLYDLLKKDVKWVWTDEHEKIWLNCKKEICKETILAHYDPNKEIIITCDASDEGISGILSHRIDGEERPVFFASRTLTSAERKYPILHREALAIVFAMEKFYKYVFGHHVEIFTDHKPLEGVLGNKKGKPSVIATRLQRYILRMSIFDYSIVYRKGENNGNSDCLSRLPIEEEQSTMDKFEEKITTINSIHRETKLNYELIKQETGKDETLQKIMNCVMFGWDRESQKLFQQFYTIRDNLNIEDDCLFLDSRVVIPHSLKLPMLNILHSNHSGVVRMKQLARRYVYWQSYGKDIDKFVKSCEDCQIHCKQKNNRQYNPWPSAKYPFERVHIDFFHFKGKTFLILVDAYSRWMEIKHMTRTTAEHVIEELKQIFSLFGWCNTIVADNGPPFQSYKVKNFFESKKINYLNSPETHSQSNGLAERAVQTAKWVLYKVCLNANSLPQIKEKVNEFLFHYRNMQTTEEEIIPSHRIFGYHPRWELTQCLPPKCLEDEKMNSCVKPVKNSERMSKKNELKENLIPHVSFLEGEDVWYIRE